MSSKRSFFKSIIDKLGLKRLFVAAIISIIILFPTIFAAIFMHRSTLESQMPTSDPLTVIMYDDNDTEVFNEIGTTSTYGDDSLVGIFNTIKKNLYPVAEIPSTADRSVPLTVHMITNDKTDVLVLYFSLEYNDSFCLLNNEAYMVSSDNCDIFFMSPYSEPLYPGSRPPTLISADNDVITPTSCNWYYKNIVEKYVTASAVTLEQPEKEYGITGEFGISFVIPPDHCSINIYSGDEVIDSWELNDAHSLKVDSNTPFRVKIVAEWKDFNRDFYGTAEYDISVIIQNSAEFKVFSNSVSKNGLTILKGKNIADISKLSFTSSDIEPPRFSIFGETAYAIIYCPADFEGDNIHFTVAYGATLSSFDISVNYGVGSDEENINNSIHQLNVDFSHITSKYDCHPYLFGKIVTPASNFTNTLKFGELDGALMSYRRVYSCSDGIGVDVYTLSGGIVSYVGHNEELGRYAVVDIGLGLSVIYSNMSSADVSVGDILAAGDVIGKTGSISRRDEQGFAISLLYNGHLFDPELLYINT